MFGGTKNTASTMETKTKIGTLIGQGAVFDGNLSAPESIRVDGTVNGNCTCEKELIVGPSGKIEGNISAQNVVISGRVNGDLSVNGKLELLSTGKIVGDITAKSLVIDEDAYFDGRCTMTTSGESSSQTAAKKLSDSSADSQADSKYQKNQAH